jgi:hypothetical protein
MLITIYAIGISMGLYVAYHKFCVKEDERAQTENTTEGTRSGNSEGNHVINVIENMEDITDNPLMIEIKIDE